MMAAEAVLTIIVSFVAGAIVRSIGHSCEAERETEVVRRYASSGRDWAVYVEPTDDKAVYRAVYEKRRGGSYEVEGRGITGALQNLIDEIEL
jgi:hypothetical protein